MKIEGISLHRQRSWCMSTDKDLAPKAAGTLGLYLSPPLKAVAISINENPGIQALEWKTGYIETRDGKMIRVYKRHEMLNPIIHKNIALFGTRDRSTVSGQINDEVKGSQLKNNMTNLRK